MSLAAWNGPVLFDYFLTHGTDSPPGVGWCEVDPARARLDLHDALRDPFVRFELAPQASVDHFHGELERVLAQLQSGRARLFRRPTAHAQLDARGGGSTRDDESEDGPLLSELAPPEASEPVAETPARPTWIEIVVVDVDDVPIQNHAFRLRLSDGSLREGTLAADGRIRFDDVVAGLCTLILPTNDELEWDPANAS